VRPVPFIGTRAFEVPQVLCVDVLFTYFFSHMPLHVIWSYHCQPVYRLECVTVRVQTDLKPLLGIQKTGLSARTLYLTDMVYRLLSEKTNVCRLKYGDLVCVYIYLVIFGKS
jgi:hypothetical protein